jgi:AcrR family transcriptional regulator
VSARERILDAAVRRIAREGIDDVRIARIATDAGVSPSLVHYHFDSRDALLAEALEHSYERAGDVRIGDADEGAPAAERLRAMIDQCLPAPGPLEDDFILWVELWLRAARRPELRATSARLYGRMHDWFRDALAEADGRGELAVPDPDASADHVLALCDGYGIRVLCGDPAMPRERARDAVWRALAAELGR